MARRSFGRPEPADKTRINEDIRAAQVRVIKPDGGHEITTSERALQIAEQYNLDLVEIAPDAKPPVCKIIDYGKYMYEKKKKEKE
ncbi:MAG TPA: translation initiation factor IF-3, partial [Balneola sp.]|nr:translation initiation factor IF-3 [Balneola sp.]